MHPPARECARLKQFDPHLRFGWLGRKRQHPDELNAGHFCVIRLRKPRHPSTPIGWRWETVPNHGPFFSADGTPFKRDWSGELVPYLDTVVDKTLGFVAHDVCSGAFMDSQFRKRWTIKEQEEAFRKRILQMSGQWKEAFDGQVAEMTGLMEMEHRKMNIRGEVLTKEDIRQALAEEPHMKEIIEKGVNFDDYLLGQVGLK